MLSLEELKNLYENALESKDKDFYLEVKKYLDYILSKWKTKRIIKKIIASQKEDSKKYKSISEKLKESLLSLKREISKTGYQDECIKRLLGTLEDYLSGKITSSLPLVESLLDLLGEALNILGEKYSEERLSLIKEYWETKKNYEYTKRVSVWNSFFELFSVKNALETDISKLSFLDKLNIGLLNHELINVINGYGRLEEGKRKDYINHLKRIHNFILSQINQESKVINLLKKPLTWILLFFIGLILTALFSGLVTNWTKSNILGEEPYPQISITKIYRIQNSEFKNFSIKKDKTEGNIEFFSYLLEDGTLFSKTLTIREDTLEAYFVENNSWIRGIMYPTDYVNDKGIVYQKNCIFSFFSFIGKDSKPKDNNLYLTTRWPDKKKEGTENLTEFSINIKNDGTEAIEKIYTKFCPDNGWLVDYSGEGIIEGNCLDIEIPYLYPGQEKYYSLYLSGENIEKVVFYSNMDKRRIPGYLVNGILVAYANSTCDRQTEATLYRDEFGLMLDDLYRYSSISSSNISK